MSNVIKPTVGRKVWYRPSKNDKIGLGAMIVAGDQPLDATVLAIWGDRCVNVLVLDIMGKPFTKTSVNMIQEGDVTPKDVDGNEVYGYVEWMPYQAKAAAREPALDALAAGTSSPLAAFSQPLQNFTVANTSADVFISAVSTPATPNT